MALNLGAPTEIPGEIGPQGTKVVKPPPSLEEIARHFPQFEILECLGRGGMGVVYKARQPKLNRVVALKILAPEKVAEPKFAERFEREAQALARLNHPNIVTVYDFGETDGLYYLTMEFVDGVSLRHLLQTRRLAPQEALIIVPKICEALQFAHDHGVVHRDIKPENVLLDKSGRVKIADFGIAKIVGVTPLDSTDAENLAAKPGQGTLTQDQVLGTPHYMAPEQVEKPQSVDHRADIYSLGVVFYEMLTGELPLGKFQPPSSRKVEVDVRLDDVVLRALEKDPQRRYQQVSQVKTAVDTIASTAASPSPTADAEALAREILARNYNLDIRSCLRRGWTLVRNNFWPLVGITALLLALFSFVSLIGGSIRRGPAGADSLEITSALALLVWGPLMGGLCSYFLKKIRGEKTTVETAFGGFSNRFLHLFLAGFVTILLTWVGFLCLIVPGIYLLVAWMFTLPLVMDKRLDFWPAMELSRKVVTKHWFKFLGFGILLLLLTFAGVLACVVGVFVMMPIVLAALMYAYEDIFGAAGRIASQPPASVGPSVTTVLPKPPHFGGVAWTPVKIGFGVVALLLGFIVVVSLLRPHRPFDVLADRKGGQSAGQVQPVAFESSEPPPTADSSESISSLAFGPVIEREIQARVTGTNQFLDLDTQQLLTPSSEIAGVLAASQPNDDENRFWQSLDIPGGSRRFQYITWLRESGADLMFAGDGKIIGFEGVFAIAHGDSSTNWDNWDGLRPEQVRAAVNVVDWTRRATEAARRSEPVPPAPTPGGIFNSAAQLDSRYGDGPIVNLLTRDQSVLWFFKTREGGMGILQVLGFENDPRNVKIRYKLLEKTSAPENDRDNAAPVGEKKISRETLTVRLEAASMMSDRSEKDKSLAVLAIDAAKAREIEIVKTSLRQIDELRRRDKTAHESARVLARQGLRKQALEIAKEIDDFVLRNQALSELAQ